MDSEKIIKEEILSAFSGYSKSEMALVLTLNKPMVAGLIKSVEETDEEFKRDEKFIRSLVYVCMKLSQYDYDLCVKKA